LIAQKGIFDTSYYLDQPYELSPPAARTLAYGETWANSSSSSTEGMGMLEYVDRPRLLHQPRYSSYLLMRSSSTYIY
jgi:hypothetical protein